MVAASDRGRGGGGQAREDGRYATRFDRESGYTLNGRRHCVGTGERGPGCDEKKQLHMEPERLTLQYLQEITDGFSEERKLGEGGYGVVFKGVRENGEEIAVKILRRVYPGFDDKQFQKEFFNLKMLQHQNIVRFVGYCYETQHIPFDYNGKQIFADQTFGALCFEYLHNGSLGKHLSNECHGLDWYTQYKIIKGACEGLKYIHQEHMYHLDLKPDNILLDKEMVPKLADFGLSRIVGEEVTNTITQSPLGTLIVIGHDNGIVLTEINTDGLTPTREKTISATENEVQTAGQPGVETMVHTTNKVYGCFADLVLVSGASAL